MCCSHAPSPTGTNGTDVRSARLGRTPSVGFWHSFDPGRLCRRVYWRRRFAKSTCPVRTHHVSFVLNHLECSHLRRITLFADYCAPTVHQNLAPIRPSSTFLASHRSAQ